MEKIWGERIQIGLWVFFLFTKERRDKGMRSLQILKVRKYHYVCAAGNDPGEGKIKMRMWEREGECRRSILGEVGRGGPRVSWNIGLVECGRCQGLFSLFCFFDDCGNKAIDGLGKNEEERSEVWGQRRRYMPATVFLM